MLRYISRGSLKRDIKDIQLWKEDATGDFSVIYAYRCLANQVTCSHNSIFKQL